MRSYTLVTVIVAASSIADTNIQTSRQRRQAAASIIGWTTPALATRSTSSFESLSIRRVGLHTARSNSPKRVSKRARVSNRADDDEDDNDHDGDDGDDADSDTDTDPGDDSDDDEDDDDKNRQSRTGAILLFLVIFLLFWFKIRPRRQRRRRRKQEEEEEYEKRRKGDEEEASNYAVDYHHQPYDPVPAHESLLDRKVLAGTADVVPKGSASPPTPPQGTAASPAELPSPVDDDREPAELVSTLRSDHSSGSRVSPPRYSTTHHPADQPNPSY
ncbi:hypothetical protein F5Y12DRAFT_21086 [Xylaria sp. FL1777]|nr:hypothetical protein F5Y12DRAFT_21086 [Xylaria sp. FL1777]